MIKAVLFDFDGTIADSEPAHLACWNRLLTPYGVQIGITFYGPNCAGERSNEIASRIIRHHEAVTVAPSIFGQQKDELYQAWTLAHDVPTMPGATELIHSLAEAGLPLGLVTGAADEAVRKTLATHGLLDRFATRVTRDNVARGKPAPDSYQLALERLGIAATEAVAFEDTAAGVQSAKAAGIYTFAIPNAYTATHDFSVADTVLSDLIAARPVVEAMIRRS